MSLSGSVNMCVPRARTVALLSALAVCCLAAAAFSQAAAASEHLVAGNALLVRQYPDTAAFPSGMYRIDANGDIELPLVGVIHVSGRPLADIRAQLETAYARYLPQPALHLEPRIRATLSGGFRQPGLYWVDPRASLWELVRLGDTPGETAEPSSGGGQAEMSGTSRSRLVDRMRWVRGDTVLTRDLSDQFTSGASLASIGFQSGDQLRTAQFAPRRFSEVFSRDVLSSLAAVLSIAASGMTTYLLYRSLEEELR